MWGDLVAAGQRDFHRSLAAGDVDRARMLLRLFAALTAVGVLHPGSFAAALQGIAISALAALETGECACCSCCAMWMSEALILHSFSRHPAAGPAGQLAWSQLLQGMSKATSEMPLQAPQPHFLWGGGGGVVCSSTDVWPGAGDRGAALQPYADSLAAMLLMALPWASETLLRGSSEPMAELFRAGPSATWKPALRPAALRIGRSRTPATWTMLQQPPATLAAPASSQRRALSAGPSACA